MCVRLGDRSADIILKLFGKLVDDRRLICVGKLRLEIGQTFDITDVFARFNQRISAQAGNKCTVCFTTRCGRRPLQRLIAGAIRRSIGSGINAIRRIVVIFRLRIDSGGRRTGSRCIVVRMIVIKVTLFLRIERVVDKLTGRIQRLSRLLAVQEIRKSCKSAVNARKPCNRRFIARNGNIRLAFIIEQIEHRILNIDLTVDQCFADHFKRIIIRPAVRLHQRITRRNKIGNHVTLCDLRRADHIAV